MITRSSIRSISTILLMAFTFSVVGLPVVMYLCPMMPVDIGSCCTLPLNGKSSPTVTARGGDCCGSYVLAERNTTPFLKSDINAGTEVSGVIAFLPASLATPDVSVHRSVSSNSPHGPATGPPLYLLNAVLLI